jgi:mRNA interferase YafQ
MKYQIEISTKFKKDYKVILKRGYDKKLLKEVISILSDGNSLPPKYKDHALTGNYIGYRECHITSDWLLIYRIENQLLILGLTRTGSHSDLF